MLVAVRLGTYSTGVIGDPERKANTVLCLVPVVEEQAPQIGISERLAVDLVGFRGPGGCLTLLDRKPC